MSKRTITLFEGNDRGTSNVAAMLAMLAAMSIVTASVGGVVVISVSTNAPDQSEIVTSDVAAAKSQNNRVAVRVLPGVSNALKASNIKLQLSFPRKEIPPVVITDLQQATAPQSNGDTSGPSSGDDQPTKMITVNKTVIDHWKTVYNNKTVQQRVPVYQWENQSRVRVPVYKWKRVITTRKPVIDQVAAFEAEREDDPDDRSPLEELHQAVTPRIDAGLMYRYRDGALEWAEQSSDGRTKLVRTLPPNNGSVSVSIDFEAESFEGSGAVLYAVEEDGDRQVLTGDRGLSFDDVPTPAQERGRNFAFDDTYEVDADSAITKVVFATDLENVPGRWWDRARLSTFSVTVARTDEHTTQTRIKTRTSATDPDEGDAHPGNNWTKVTQVGTTTPTETRIRTAHSRPGPGWYRADDPAGYKTINKTITRTRRVPVKTTQTVTKQVPVGGNALESVATFDASDGNGNGDDGDGNGREALQQAFTLARDTDLMYRMRNGALEWAEQNSDGQQELVRTLPPNTGRVQVTVDFEARSFEGSGAVLYAVDENGTKYILAGDRGLSFVAVPKPAHDRGSHFTFDDTYEVNANSSITKVVFATDLENVPGTWGDRARLSHLSVKTQSYQAGEPPQANTDPEDERADVAAEGEGTLKTILDTIPFLDVGDASRQQRATWKNNRLVAAITPKESGGMQTWQGGESVLLTLTKDVSDKFDPGETAAVVRVQVINTKTETTLIDKTRRVSKRESWTLSNTEQTITQQNRPPSVNPTADTQLVIDDETPAATVSTTARAGASDPDGDTLTYSWVVSTGDASAVRFSDPAAAQPTVTFDSTGTFSLQVMAADGAKQDSDAVTVRVTGDADNKPPTVTPTAADDTLHLGAAISTDSTTLFANANDPDGDQLDYTWAIASGDAGDVWFSTAHTARPTVTIADKGTFTFRVTVDDNHGHTASGTVTVTAGENYAPTARATAPANVTLHSPRSVTLDASQSTDPGAPDSQLTYAWQLTAGDQSGVSGVGNGKQDAITISKPGTYTFQVRVTDSDGATDTATVTVTATQPPTVSISGPTSVEQGQQVIYTAEAQDQDENGASIADYTWIVDGQPVTGENDATLDYTFEQTGDHSVKVQVTDDEGQTATDSLDANAPGVTVTGDPPTVSITGPASVKQGQSVSYIAQAHDQDEGKTSIQRYVWYVDGTQVGTGKTLTTTFEQTGDKPVTVQVTDDEGQTAADTKQVTANGKGPSVTIAGPQETAKGTQATFTAHAEDHDEGQQRVTSYVWYVDGTQVGSGRVLRYTFDHASIHSVTVQVTDDEGQIADAKQEVTVTESPTVTVSGPTSVEQGQRVIYTADAADQDENGAGIADYTWVVDGETVAGENDATLSYTFTETGAHSVTARVTDDEGQTAADSLDANTAGVTVSGDDPTVSISGPSSVEESNRVTYTADASDQDESGGSIQRYVWYVNGDRAGTGQRLTTSFDNTGTPNVKVRVTDDEGQTDTARQVVSVTGDDPTVSISGPGEMDPGEQVTFTADARDGDEGGNSITGYIWFKDGTRVGTGQQLTTALDNDGTLKVRVTDDEGQTASDTQSVDVTAPPTVTLSGPDERQEGLTGTYQASASDPDGGRITDFDWWVAGQSQAASGSSLIHYFGHASTVTVKVQVTDDEGLTATATKRVEVTTPPTVSIDGPSTLETLERGTYTASASDSDGGQIQSYSWSIKEPDGQYTAKAGRSIWQTFYFTGTATVRVTVTDDEGQTASATKQVEVTSPPRVSIRGPDEATKGKRVSFTAAASDPDGGDIAATGYVWWIDGVRQGESGKSLSHTFTDFGTYTVKVKAIDDEGQTNTDTHIVKVRNHPPEAPSISATPRDVDVFGDRIVARVSVNGQATDPDGQQLSWTLKSGSGEVQNHKASTYTLTYERPGTYTVSLTVEDPQGQTDTATTTVDVSKRVWCKVFGGTNQDCHLTETGITLSASDTTVKTGTPVTFTANLKGWLNFNRRYTWTFGDGSTPTDGRFADNEPGQELGRTVTHTFDEPGIYTVEVLAEAQGVTPWLTSKTIERVDRVTIRVKPSTYTEYHYPKQIGTQTRVATDVDNLPGDGWGVADKLDRKESKVVDSATRKFDPGVTGRVVRRVWTPGDGGTYTRTETTMVTEEVTQARRATKPGPGGQGWTQKQQVGTKTSYEYFWNENPRLGRLSPDVRLVDSRQKFDGYEYRWAFDDPGRGWSKTGESQWKVVGRDFQWAFSDPGWQWTKTGDTRRVKVDSADYSWVENANGRPVVDTRTDTWYTGHDHDKTTHTHGGYWKGGWDGHDHDKTKHTHGGYWKGGWDGHDHDKTTHTHGGYWEGGWDGHDHDKTWDCDWWDGCEWEGHDHDKTWDSTDNYVNDYTETHGHDHDKTKRTDTDYRVRTDAADYRTQDRWVNKDWDRKYRWQNLVYRTEYQYRVTKKTPVYLWTRTITEQQQKAVWKWTKRETVYYWQFSRPISTEETSLTRPDPATVVGGADGITTHTHRCPDEGTLSQQACGG